MTTSIKPIETRYAGCRFRSRLEARWAVFFDHLGVEWQYEPEGFEIGTGYEELVGDAIPRGTLNFEKPTTVRYLPDFYLPQYMTWVEVKGGDRIGSVGLLNLVVAAIDPATGDTLPDADNGMYWNRANGKNTGLLLLSDIPDPRRTQVIAHAMFEWHKGVRRSPHRFMRPAAGRPLLHECRFDRLYLAENYDGTCFPATEEESLAYTPVESYQLIDGLPYRMDPAVLDAYAAARSARFEYGERG